MGGYIRVDKDQPNDTRLLDLADRVADSWQVSVIRGEIAGAAQFADDLSAIENRHALRNALLGALVTLWCYADTHIRSDDTLPVTVSGLAPVLGLPVTVLKAFPRDWLIERKDGIVELPGYCAKNGITPKDIRKENNDARREHERAKARERQQRHRDKQRESVTGVTSRKKRRDSHGVTGHTGTGTGTSDLTSTVPARAAPLAAALEAAATPRKSFDEDFRGRFGTEPRIKAADAPAGHGRKP
jgi:hypothetical protein